VLCVCEGNLCRSPVAELLLADALGPDVEVGSAGTHAVVGAPIAPEMRALLLGRSVESDAFRARQLQPADLRAADLVLTMTVRQRGRAVELAPAVVRRAFTLRELARLLGEVDPAELSAGTLTDRFRQALPAAAARRRYRADPRDDDIADPYGREGAAYRRAFDQVADAVDRISGVLAAPA
jgi:protein-tyrosine phosphatase